MLQCLFHVTLCLRGAPGLQAELKNKKYYVHRKGQIMYAVSYINTANHYNV
jgi:hypothetical protein